MTWLVAGLFVLLPFMAAAQLSCGDHDSMVNKLREYYGETYVWFGVTPPSVPYVVELHLQLEGGGFTLLRVYPSGVACISEAGLEWGVPMSSESGEPS